MFHQNAIVLTQKCSLMYYVLKKQTFSKATVRICFSLVISSVHMKPYPLDLSKACKVAKNLLHHRCFKWLCWNFPKDQFWRTPANLCFWKKIYFKQVFFFFRILKFWLQCKRVLCQQIRYKSKLKPSGKFFHFIPLKTSENNWFSDIF